MKDRGKEAQPLRIRVSCPAPVHCPRLQEPVRVGVPWPRGVCASPSEIALRDPMDAGVPVQAIALDRWPDGSVRWSLLDFLANVDRGQSLEYRVALAAASDPPDVLQLEESAGSAVIDVGCGTLIVEREPFELRYRSVLASGSEIARARLQVVGEDGTSYQPSVDRVEVEATGAIRATIRVSGTLRAGRRGRPDLSFSARIHVFRDLPTIKLELTIGNPRRAQHPAGRWALGDPGSVLLRDVSFDLEPATNGASRVLCSPDLASPLMECGTPFEIYQDSSGGERWNSRTHVNRNGRVPQRFRGYRLRSPDGVSEGLRASPVVALVTGGQRLAITSRYFWEECPRAIEAGDGRLRLGLLPRQFDDVHELQGGERKSFEFAVSFGDDPVTSVPLDWCRAPLVARCDPASYCAAEASVYLVPASNDRNAGYLNLVQAAIEGPDCFQAKRERIDEYGWRNFGDLYADHEAVQSAPDDPLVSHYNNQYDAVAGFAIHFFRTGDLRWWELMDILALHVADIDIYHTTEDRSAYNGGLFWHTQHYTDAATSTHRTYPDDPAIAGGGPSAEHNYSTGLMLHYYLTGNIRSREAALGLAQWVIDMEDGALSPFRWLDRGPTGLASMTGSMSYYGPGRAPGNAIVVLMNAHRLDGARGYLEMAERLIRRCIHPRDDLGARRLLDAERRWYYTVFLQAVGEYLDRKVELGELDLMYAYGRESLLHYARWMTEHEYPYLEKPEILEFPNETWAAQDMRKSDALKLAARHAQGAERALMLDRARFFFHVSTSMLASMPTRTLTRPLVLMLTHGYMQAWFDEHVDALDRPAPAVSPDFGEPLPFEPQKLRAVRRAIQIGVLGALAASALLVWGAFFL